MQLASHALDAGERLILVNGYAAAAADWDPAMLAVLAESFRRICLDNRVPGTRRSACPVT